MSKADVVAAKPKRAPKPEARRYRGVAASERVDERRRQFIAAGLACFGTRGYHTVTVRELCAEAHLTERYFYESFRDREALFAAVYQDLVDQLRQDFMAAALPLAPDLRAMARTGIGVFFRRLKSDPRVARMLLVEVLTVSREMESQAMHATFGFGDLLRQMTVSNLTDGTADCDPDCDADIPLIAAGLIGATVHIAMRWTADDFAQPVERVIDTAMGFYEATLSQIQAGPALPPAA